jgi:hypothetical protein
MCKARKDGEAQSSWGSVSISVGILCGDASNAVTPA